MGAVIIEHVKVGDLPEAWRERLAKPSDARVTVRIEDEAVRQETAAADAVIVEDPAFGIWRDRDDVADVDDYVRKIRAPRYGRDGARGGS